MADGAPAPAFLPYGRQSITAADVQAVAAALGGELLTTGPLVEAFETALAERLGSAHAVVCGNGTQALHLAYLAAGLEPSDAVIVPSITFMATANAAAYVGAGVIFCDVEASTGLMTPQTLADAFAEAARQGLRVRLAVPVHLAGLPADLAGLATLAQANGAELIEDACHALGGADAEAPLGRARRSRAACFSFHPVKTLTTAEGGAVVTNDAALAARARRLRGHGIVRDAADFLDLTSARDGEGEANPWWHEQQELGFNYRLPDVLCALGLSQLQRLDQFIARRRSLTRAYQAALAPLSPYVQVAADPPGSSPARHLLQVAIDFAALGLTRAQVMAGLRRRGIGSQVHYIPVHRQPYWRARLGERHLPGAEAFYGRTLSLPLYPDMADDDPARVTEALAQVLGLQP